MTALSRDVQLTLNGSALGKRAERVDVKYYPQKRRKGLLVAPRFPENTFWGYNEIVHWTSHKTLFPPLGLLTFAAYMPDNWDFELVDLNVVSPSAEELKERIEDSDVVFTGGMAIQKPSLVNILERSARGTGRPVVLGGPIASTYWRNFVSPSGNHRDNVINQNVDLIVWGEAQNWIPQIHGFLGNGRAHEDGKPRLLIPDRIAAEKQASYAYLLDGDIFEEFVDVRTPRWDLLNHRDYANLTIQTTAGCPFRCDFCDIIKFTGGKTRGKSEQGVWNEFQAVYDTGYRGRVMTVDDNFIGDPETTEMILDTITDFQREHDYPFMLYTQASVNLGTPKLEHLIGKMRRAGFDAVFLGIENPDPAALRKMNKKQNIGKGEFSLDGTVRKIQKSGIEVYAGFIYGGDEDTMETPERIVEFIEQAPVFSAMTGMLIPLPGTKLHERLGEEGRLREDAGEECNNVGNDVQFEPLKMSRDEMARGMNYILERVFDLSNSYGRAGRVLEESPNHIFRSSYPSFSSFRAALLSLWNQGIKKGFDRDYFGLLWKGFTLDRRRASATRGELRVMDEVIGTSLDDPFIEEVSVDGQREYWQQLRGHAHDYMIRFQPEVSREEIDLRLGRVDEGISEGRLTAKLAREVYSAAREHVSKYAQMHSRNWPTLVHAFGLAARAYHYGIVKDSIVHN